MKRDFTYETQQTILKYADDVEHGISWKSIGDGILDIYHNLKIFFSGGAKAAASKEEWDRYYASIIEVKDYNVEKINKIFEGARNADHDFAVRARNKAADGEYLLTELKKITDIAQNRTLERIGTLAPLNTSLRMSDRDLTEWFQETSYTSLGYRSAITYTSDCFLSMGVTTAMLTSVFHYKNILKADVFNTPNGTAILNVLKQDILNGTCPYITIKDIAQSLGITENEARSLLDKSYYARNYDKEFDYQKSREWILNKQKYQKKCDELLKQKLEALFSDEEQFEEFCKRYANDYTAETTSAILNGEVEGYTVELYQTTIMNTLETCADRQDVTVYPSEVKDYIKGYEFVYKTYYEGGVDISNLSDEEIVTKIKEYLINELGYDKVTDRDIELCKKSTQLMRGLDEVNTVGGYMQDTVDLLSYMVADYANEIQLLDSLGEIGADSSEFQIAMENIRKIYTDKAATVVNEVLQEGFVKGSEKVFGKLTEATLPSLKIVNLGISVVGAGSGLTGYTGAAQDVIGYSMICPEMVEIYDDAVRKAAESGYDQTSLVNVRNAFSMMKQSMLSYYDAQIEYTEGYLRGLAGADKNYQSYIRYERAKLESLQLGQEYEPITYSVYKERYGIG